MNPLQHADLGAQRRLLESKTAYATARLVANIVLVLFGIVGVFAGFVWISLGNEVALVAGDSGIWPQWRVFAHRALFVVAGLTYPGAVYLTWMAVRAYFDMADASLAHSLQGPQQRPPASSDDGPSPGQSPDTWPEPPKPLIPASDGPRAEDAKYMPKG